MKNNAEMSCKCNIMTRPEGNERNGLKKGAATKTLNETNRSFCNVFDDCMMPVWISWIQLENILFSLLLDRKSVV